MTEIVGMDGDAAQTLFDGEEGDKRQCLPFEIKSDCPNCGAPESTDLYNTQYLSYPVWGKRYDLNFSCDACDHEWIVQVIPRVSHTLELVE